ncbi:MAG: GNAT family N-acetyltransferase [Desulfobacula sp.]|nr:GNAT family N-acetyltransferase [Desulfobacula sp.]
MKIEYKFNLDEINWSDAAELFKLAPLGVRDPVKLCKSCEKSYLTCFAFDAAKLIGMGRALSDGECQAAIYDLVVLPEYQGRGVGKEIMEQIHSRLTVETIILYSVPGKEVFYKKLGYRKMLTAMAKKVTKEDNFRSGGYIK